MKTLAQPVEPTEVLELVPQILRLKKILVPIDFSETSKKAFQYALKFASLRLMAIPAPVFSLGFAIIASGVAWIVARAK